MSLLLALFLSGHLVHAYESNSCRSVMTNHSSSAVVVKRSGHLENQTKPCSVTLFEYGRGYVLRFEAKGIFGEFYDPYAQDPALRPDLLLSDRVMITTLNPIGARGTFEGKVYGGKYPTDYRDFKASLDFRAKEAVLRGSQNLKCIFD